ncbi:restriction endonuclease BgcI [Arthrobacter sp. YC-RL1]|uniref:HsdM family class I SAM-dependent methyltransferase n=1 Tax=Arthrobacter sp. YC-RL1 TaxID=1652545 RepID=UPI00063D8B50|nr:N-6 DNA methylase [Arthrobacter sp. YC-RL1]ALQ32641.1 restriction endonuclease [Arthrobacter sp. YC-RL1]KLI90707.1 restriction endonuclease BgcI [Arthrobacter sp. YC-RL1]
MGNERATDQFVRDLLREIGVERPWEQEGGPQWKRNALRGGSKSATGIAEGKPEFVFLSEGFVVMIEDKREVRFTRRIENGLVTTDYPFRADYALNGAVHYAQTMLDNGIPHDKGIFAVGVGGDEEHHEIAVVYLGAGMVKQLDDLDNLDVFAADQINEYHAVQVLDERPRAEVRLDDIRAAAERLHEGMRNYGSVENNRKAPLVSAILLALKNDYFDITQLQGRTPGNNGQVWDGRIIYDAAKQYMESEALMPQQKIGTLLDQFAYIRTSPPLNRVHRDLGESPLKWMTRILADEVMHAVTDPSMTAFDVLGNFYHEFIAYGGGDGSGLGIVLTPEHVTTLMAELIDISASDYVLDPTAGTASFLIAAMHRMFQDAGHNETLKEQIRRERLHGIELQDKLFAIGTTNMILRGDGKANFRRDSIFEAPLHEMRGDIKMPDGSWAMGHGFTKVLLNPPYSQSKDKSTRNLSELAFIEKALTFLNPGGRLAAIVPQSTMVGKTKEDKARKKQILTHNSLDMVITMNPMTFANSGHTPHTVVAVFTAGRPHKRDAKVKFINFEDDGYKVAAHRGLVDTGIADSRRRHLIDVINGDAQADTGFIVRSEVMPEDEWQHSYFYFNDQPPQYEDFLATAADYVTWQVDMHAHGLGDLITPTPKSEESELEEGVTV